MANKLEWYGGNGSVSIEEIRIEIEKQIADITFDFSDYAKKDDIPQNVSDLNNDSGYQTATEVDSAIDAKLSGYQPAISIDATLSDTSENPVQNKVIKAALDSVTSSGVVVDTVLSNTSENPVQNKVITDALNGKQDKLTADNAGNAISIENDSNGKPIISYIGESGGGITEERAREIASEQATQKIADSNLATKDDIPKNVSDLNNDTGYAKTSDIPAPYDDTDIKNSLSTIDGKISDLEEKTSGLENGITVSEFFGQLTPGKTYPPGTTLEDIIKDILDPAVPPTITEPKLTINGSDIQTEIESGQTKSATITLTFDRGMISSGGNTVGEAIEYSLNGGAYQSSNIFNVVVSEANKVFTGKVRYGEGDQPKDSKGENYGDPRIAGELESDSITYKFAAPVSETENTIWSNATDISKVVKMTNVKESDKQWTVAWVPQTEDEPEIFDIPASWDVVSVETINNLTNQWQTIVQSFDISDTTHDGIAYKRYTDNREYDDSGRSIRVTWS